MAVDYIWVIGLHVAAVTVWMAGMFFAAILISALDPATAAEEGPARILRAAGRWDRRVTSPAMGLAWLLGLTLVVIGGWGLEPWLVAKVTIVIALSALHGTLAAGLRRLADPSGRPVPRLLRLSPLAIIAGAIAIVTLAVVKPY